MTFGGKRARLIAAGAVVVAAGVFAAWPGGAPREAVAAVTKYRECFITGQSSTADNATVGFGDSITAGASNSFLRVGANNSYFDVLACEPDSPITYVANKGIWRNTTGQMLARLDADVIALRPSRVLVLGGTNDVRNGDSAPSVENLDEIRARLAEAGIKATFGLIPPSEDMPAETKQFNDRLRAWAAAGGVELLDYWTPLADADGTYRDGMNADNIHPSPAGARVMADVAADSLR